MHRTSDWKAPQGSSIPVFLKQSWLYVLGFLGVGWFGFPKYIPPPSVLRWKVFNVLKFTCVCISIPCQNQENKYPAVYLKRVDFSCPKFPVLSEDKELVLWVKSSNSKVAMKHSSSWRYYHLSRRVGSFDQQLGSGKLWTAAWTCISPLLMLLEQFLVKKYVHTDSMSIMN